MRSGGKRATHYDPYNLPHRLGALLFVAALLLFGAGVFQLGPDLRAVHGQGTRGTWVVQAHVCDQHGSCWWEGDFFLPDGQETHRHIKYEGSPAHIRTGLRVPALDTGNQDTVYPVTGSSTGLTGDILFMLFSGGVIALFVTRWTLRFRRRRPGGGRRRRAGTGLHAEGRRHSGRR